MADTVNSTNMAMPVPVVGVAPGPDYATDINSCLTIVDAHDHSSGNGVKVTPDGLNIASDLSFNTTSSATNLYKAAFTSQAAALTGTNFLSFIGGNLYANDGSGNQIPITSGGGVAGSPGSIGSLASPAAATYSAGSKLFTWTADSLKAAAMDNGAITIRETNVASAKGITIQSPTSLAADYSLTLPTALPGSASYLSCDSSGNLGTATADGIGAAMTSTGANSVAASRTRSTGTTVAAGGVAISASCGTFSLGAPVALTDVTNLTVTITTSGRPVKIMCVSANTTSTVSAFTGIFQASNTGSGNMAIAILRGGSVIAGYVNGQNYTNTASQLPASVISFVDAVAAGTYTYKIQIGSGNATTIYAADVKLVAYEL